MTTCDALSGYILSQNLLLTEIERTHSRALEKVDLYFLSI